VANHYFSRDGQRLQLCLLDPIKDWSRLCRAVKHPELVQDPRFATPEGRSENAKALVAILDAIFAEREISEWGKIFAEHEVIWSPMPTARMVAADPQMHDNGLLPAIVESQLKTVANPLQLEGVTAVPPHLAPEIGEHSEEILLGLGYSHDEIAELERSRLIKVGRPAPSQMSHAKGKVSLSEFEVGTTRGM
jgi:formyl-CoA transferase